MSRWRQRIRFWVQGLSPIPLLTGGTLAAVLFILYACQDTSQLTQPSTSIATVTHKLTILASGNGSGVVTSSPSGINCHITLGATGSPGCTNFFSSTTTVTLTQVPSAGHAFAGWTSTVAACSGTGTCKVGMSV